MKTLLLLAGLLYAVSSEAAYREDKEECESWGRAFYLVATWRPTISKVDAYDRVIAKNSDDKEALSDAVLIIWVAYDLKGTPEEIRKSAIETCMKQRGHTGV